MMSNRSDPISHPPWESTRRPAEGHVLLVVIVLLSAGMALALTTLSAVSGRERDLRHGRNLAQARFAAQSAVERQVADIKAARDAGSGNAPFALLEQLDPNAATGPGGYSQTVSGAPLLDLGGAVVAEYDVFVDVSAATGTSRQISVTGYAYIPTKAAYEAGEVDSVRADAHTVTEIAFRGSEVFDYSYFINHWGWFYGNTIVANGNVRSNGQFDFGGYAATVNGTPRYQGANGSDLIGYLDDNGDGVKDGSDGGTYSSMGIVNAGNVRGMGGAAQNQHIVPDQVSMPNLSELGHYESKATSSGATISIAGNTLVNGVLGDDVGEKSHVYLVGTAANPIVLNGEVVVRGSVIISGYVSGQGSIYAGGNIYIPKNLQYVDGPSTATPSGTSETTVESWRANNAGKDSLGLFAREHVVIGDYTNSTWQSNVSSWINHSLNESKEDAGLDGIQNTRKGPDGVLGTADDDVLEGDGVWTVSRYTAADAAAGRIPAGRNVGDVIPGSGEDIDGDGRYDPRTAMSEFNIPQPLNPTHWAGLSSTVPNYRDISTVNISRIDGALYTNHALAALMINWGGDIAMNGSIVSRNESIIYGANRILMNHDQRLAGRGSATSGFETAVGWDPIELVQWEFSKPLPQGVGESATQIGTYLTGVTP